MNRLLRPRIWPSFRASSGLAPCDVLNKYASGPSPAVPRDGCPVARPSPRSRDGVSCIMRADRFLISRPTFYPFTTFPTAAALHTGQGVLASEDRRAEAHVRKDPGCQPG